MTRYSETELDQKIKNSGANTKVTISVQQNSSGFMTLYFVKGDEKC